MPPSRRLKLVGNVGHVPSLNAVPIGEQLRQAVAAADSGFSQGILQAIVALRWLTLTWAAIGVFLGWEHVRREWLAVLALGSMLIITVAATAAARHRPSLLTKPGAVLVEFVVAGGVLLADNAVFTAERAQSLPWAWPSAVIITAAIFVGSLAGGVTAVALGIASYLGDARNSLEDWGTSASSKTGLYVLAAVVASYVAQRLRQAEREIGTARARDEISRTLHDGVLQTLAVVQRRSDDPELAALAKQQDQDLRDFLYGVEPQARTLNSALREVAAEIRHRDSLQIDVIAAEDLPEMAQRQVEAVAGAVQEALTNVAKHASASKAIVYAEPTDSGGVFCSVKDDGVGFDVATTDPGRGITGSIKQRMMEAGGRSEFRARPGRGTEVQLWVDG